MGRKRGVGSGCVPLETVPWREPELIQRSAIDFFFLFLPLVIVVVVFSNAPPHAHTPTEPWPLPPD